MYRDWYAAYVNQISTEDTASFLFLTGVLRNPSSDIPLLKSSLEEAENHLEFNMQIYILPYLAKIAVNKEHVLQKEAKGIIRRIAANFSESVANEAARNIDEPNSVRMQIRRLGSTNPVSVSLSEEDYIILPESINSIMCLSALMNYDKEMIHSIAQEELCAEFLIMALKGCFGRYAMVLAQEVCLLSGSANLFEAAKAYQKNSKTFYEFPDTIEILLKFYFHGKSAEEILKTAFDPKILLFDRFAGECEENTEFWLSLGLPQNRAENQYVKQLRILWENIAVYLAIQSAMNEQRLLPVIGYIAAYWEKQRAAYDVEDIKKSQNARCPWMFRGNQVYTKTRSAPFAEYKWMGSQAVALKAAMSAPLLFLIFSNNKKKLPEFLYELLLNLADAYSGSGVTQSIAEGCFRGNKNAREIYFSDALISLLAYAKRLIGYVGKGYLDNTVPEQLFLNVEKYSKHILNGEDAGLSLQRKYLHCGPSVMVCVSLAYEEASAEFPEVKKGDYWMKGGDSSFARKLCKIALNDFWNYIRNSGLYKSSPEGYVTKPIDLAYEHFPDLIKEADIYRDDWLHHDEGKKLPKNTQIMLLLQYEASEWKGEKEFALGSYSIKDKQYSIAFAANMHRINAILQDNDSIDEIEREILNDWIIALIKMDTPKSFSRSSRFLATEVLEKLLKVDAVSRLNYRGEGLPEKDAVSQLNYKGEDLPEKDAADMIQIVVETITDLSRQAPFYQYAVAEVILKSTLPDNLSVTHDIIKCIFFHILLSQEKEAEAGNTVLTDPYKISQQEKSRDIRRQIIYWYLGNISDRIIDEGTEVRDRLIQMIEKWYQRSGYKKEKLIIKADSIKIKEGSISICDEDTEDDKWYEWEPDVLEARKKSENQTQWEEEVFVKKEKGRYHLPEKGFLEFLIEKGFSSRKAVKVVFQNMGKEGYLFSAGTGNHYRILPEFIEEESLKSLQQRIYKYKDETKEWPRGLYLHVKIDMNTHGKIPQLKIEGFGTENLDYMGLFYDSEYVRLEETDKRKINKKGVMVEAGTKNPEKDMVVDEEGWGACAQRCGKVRLKAIEKKRLEVPGSDADIKRRIEYLYGLYKNEEGREYSLEVRLMSKGKAGNGKNSKLLQGLTREQMPVKIEADSIMFGEYRYSLRAYAACIVSWSPAINERLDDKNKCRGVIWEISKVIEGNRLIKVKYICNDKVYEEQVKSSGMEKVLKVDTLYAGMPVLYDNRNKTIIPVFYHPKDKPLLAGQYRVRYLWKMKKCTENDVKKIQSKGSCADLGVHRIGNGEDIFHLTQDFESGRVYAVKKNNAAQEELDESALKAEVTMYDAWDDLIDVHHLKEAEEEFKDVPGLSDIPNQSRRLAKLYFEQYMEWRSSSSWMNNNCLHAEGIVIEENGNRYFEIREPLKYLPYNGNDVSEEDAGKWTKRIKLREEGPQLADSSKWAYAKIELSEDGSFEADVDHTEPYSWEQFQKWLYKKFRNKNEYELPLFYRDAADSYLHFEWGIGRHFMLPETRLKVLGSKKGTISQWFYGDKISCFKIEGKGRDAFLVAEIENYDFSIEHRIKEDAEKDILQYVKVRFDKERDRVTAEESTVSKPRLSNEEHAWSFEKVKAAGLKGDVEKKVKEALPDGGRGCILVQLDRRKSKKRLVFGMAQLKTFNSFIMCLKGGEICRNGNDYYVTFSTECSDCAMIGDDSEVSVNVYRRSFSYNESTLRVYFEKDKNAFQKYMFVKIYNKNGGFQGDIKNLPWRPQHIVRDWLSRYGEQDVVTGKKHKSKNLMQIEIKPGVFCGAEFSEEIKEGVTGRLYLKGESVFVKPISCSDDCFLTEGRIVELLMLDNAFGSNMKPEQFTAAGMPQIKLGNQELAEELRNRRPPRYGKILEGSLHAAENVHYGLLKVEAEEGTGKEKIVFYRYCKNQARIFFNRMTFFDAGISEIRKHIKRGQWHYHDRFTKVHGYRGLIPYGENSDLPIIFNADWGLRFKEDELEKYIYPPHELEEFGLPEDQQGLDYRYPIAGRTEKGILVELSPGRIVKIPDSLLYIVDKNKTVGKLCTTYLSEGDVVKLSTVVPEPGKPIQIRLTDVDYGLRSLIRKRAFLPIISSQKGCMTAGGGFYQLKYPETSIQNTDICILDKTNNHMKYKKTLPQPEDLVFLELNSKKEIKVTGFPDLSVHISKTAIDQKKADATDWFMKAFSYEEGRNRLFGIMQNRIPMAVDKIEDNEIYVYYPHPPLPEENEVLCCQVIGVVSRSTVCLRSGSLLFAVDISREIRLPGRDAAAEIAKRLRPGEKIWVHYVDHSFRIGCYKSKHYGGREDKRKVIVEEVIDCAGEHGFLCKDVLSREFYWMPVENICRAEHVSAEAINEIPFLRLRKREQISVEIDNRGYASYLKNNMSLSVPFEALRPDERNKIIKVVVCSEIENIKTGWNLYLCYERPRGNIYLLQAELKHKENEKLDAYCVKKGENTAVLMPCSEIRTSIHLSPQLIKAVQQSYRGIDGDQNPETRRDMLVALLKEYREKCRETGNGLLCLSERMQDLKEYADTDSGVIEYKSEIPGVVKQYFEQLKCEEGKEVHMSLENAIYISAVAQSANGDDWKAAGRSVLSIIKKNIRYYCCEEILLEKWFLLSEYGACDLRTLLNSVYLGGVELKEKGEEKRTDQKNGSLTVNQVEKIRNACETILRRRRDNESDEIVKLALCLLEVSGQMKNYPQYSSELQEAVEKTRCYEMLVKKESIEEMAGFVLNLPEDHAFHSIGAHEPLDIINIFDSLC